MEDTQVKPAPEAEAEAPAPEEISTEQLFVTGQASPEESASSHVRAMIEAVVYITDEPLTAAQIAAALEQPVNVVAKLLEELTAEYNKPEHGLTVREVAGGYKMGTKPEHHEAIRTFVKSLKPPLKLSLAALETLSVIAYKQPITAPEVLEIRGVQGAGVLKTLIDRKLIAPSGRKNVIGRPILYKTTKEFLIQFGLKDLSELPSLKEFEELSKFALSDSETESEAAPQSSSAQQPERKAPVEEPETEPRDFREPDTSHDPGPAEDPEEQPVKEDV